MQLRKFFIGVMALASTICHSQVLYHDDWESYRPNTQDWATAYSWSPFEYNLDAGESLPTVVEGARDGIEPFSGKQMFELRGSALGASRTHYVAIPRPRWDDYPAVDMSFRFAIAKSYSAKTWLSFGLQGGTFGGNNIANGIVRFDTFKNTFKGVSSGDKPLVLLRDTWNELTSRIDWATKKITLRLNGQIIDSASFAFGQSQPPFRINSAYFQVAPQQQYASDYPIDQGVPGMLLDDIKMTAVPEPSGYALILLSLLSAVRRRKTACVTARIE